MNVIRNYNDKNIGCALLAFQLISIRSRTGVYAVDVISASLHHWPALTVSSSNVCLR